MAVLFMHSASASRGLELWDASGGSPTVDQTTPHTGDSSLLFDASGESVTKNNAMADDGRISIYVRLSATPSAQFTLLRLGFAGGEEFDVEINTSRQVVLTGNTLNKSGSTAIATGTWTQIALRRDIVSTSSYTINVYVGGSTEDFNATGADGTLNSGGSESMVMGIVAGSPSIDVRTSDEYVDDVDVAEYPGDIRVVWKKAGTVNSDQFNTTTGSGAVNESPFNTSNGKEETRSSTQFQDYNLISESDTDGGASEDLTDKAIFARTFFIWAQRDNGGAGNPAIVHDDTANAITLNNGSPTLHIVNKDRAGYPPATSAGRVGLRSTGASADSHLFEAGCLFAYFGDTMAFSDAEFSRQNYRHQPEKVGSNFYCVFLDKNHTSGPTRAAAFEATNPSDADASDWTNVGEVGFVVPQQSLAYISDSSDLHMATADNGGRVRYHVFDPGGGTWTTRHENASDAGGTVTADVACDITRRSDGDVVVTFVDSSQDGAYSRLESGTWTRDVDWTGAQTIRGIRAQLGSSDRVHFFAYDLIGDDIIGRTLLSTNSFGDSLQTYDSTAGANTNSISPTTSYSSGAQVRLVYENLSGALSGLELTSADAPSAPTLREITGTVPKVVQDHIPMGLAVDGTTLHIVYSEDSDNDLYRSDQEDGSAWSLKTEEQDAVTINRVSSNVYDHSGTVLAWFEDNAGTVEYYESSLAAADIFPDAYVMHYPAIIGPPHKQVVSY